jgi:hypothetical protein
VATAFFVNGATFSNWIPRIPEVRDALGISNGTLGLVLVGSGLGGVAGSLLTAPAQRRLGSARTVLGAAVTLSLTLPLVAVAASAVALGAVLVAQGTLDVLNDLAMNAQGSLVQTALGQPIIQRLHACWSAGAVVGTGLGTLAAAADMALGWHLSLVAVVLVLATLNAWRFLLPDGPAPVGGAGSRQAHLGASLLTPAAVRLALAALGAAVMEGSANDWSAVVLRDGFAAREGAAGVATFVVAGTMLVGRAGGDQIGLRLGPDRMLRRAVVLAAAGIVVVGVAPVTAVALVGFALWGAGNSVLFPRLYDLGASQPTLTPAVGLAAMAVGQRVGFLAAPLAVGSLADAADVQVALLVAALAAAGLVAGALFRPERPTRIT